MKCLAIDDEPLALAQLSDYISRVPFLSLVKPCQDAFEAMKVLSDEDVDLIFVDINMPDLNGLDFIRSLISPPLRFSLPLIPNMRWTASSWMRWIIC